MDKEVSMMAYSYEEIKEQAAKAASELVDMAKLQKGDVLVVGCSSSEVVGLHIGKGSDINAAQAIYEGIQGILKPKGIYLAAQCCEHLNRAVIVEKAALLPGTEIVNVVPHPHAGGSRRGFYIPHNLLTHNGLDPVHQELDQNGEYQDNGHSLGSFQHSNLSFYM